MKKIYICSVSFGKDSLAMLLRLLAEHRHIDEVIFFDTGMEFNAIYNNRNRIMSLLQSKGIRYTELGPAEPFWVTMLIRQVNGAKGTHYGYDWCGGCTRWGTAGKLTAIKNHYRELYPDCEIFEYVGIAADEPERVKTETHKIYPLVSWGMAESDCLDYCYKAGYDWEEDGVELYAILDRVSCWCCGNKNLRELKAIYQYLPKYWAMLKGLQSRIDRPFKGPGKSIFELEKRFDRELEIEAENSKYIQLEFEFKL